MAKNPYTLTKEERELALDLFARGKPLAFVIRQIAKSKGTPTTTVEIRQQITQALRTVNPNSHVCSAKSLKEIRQRQTEKKRDRRRAKFNIVNSLLEALELHTTEAALDVAKAALENIDDPRKLKALIQAINLLESSEDFMESINDKSEPGDAGDNQRNKADAQRTIEALVKIVQGSDGNPPDA